MKTYEFTVKMNFTDEVKRIIESGNHSGLTEKASSYYYDLAEKVIKKLEQMLTKDDDFDYVFSMFAGNIENSSEDDEWTYETALKHLTEIFTVKAKQDVMQKAFKFMKHADQLDIELI